MVVQPSFAEVGWPALLPLAVAVVFAFFMLVTRQIARETDPVALQGATAILALPVLLPLAFLPVASDLPMVGWITPRGWDVTLFVLLRGDRGGGASLHDVVAALSRLRRRWPRCSISRSPSRRSSA
jgi:drug/metabolite transporter (DMT)-like permease